MRANRHPNPLIDTRRPQRNEPVGVNPPGFIWCPAEGARGYVLELARDRKFTNEVRRFDVAGPRALFVPDAPLPAGRWYWRWATAEQSGRWSQPLRFDILDDAAEVVLGAGDELVARLGDHPRTMVPPGGVAALRRHWADTGRDLLADLNAEVDALLDQPHSLDEPPFLSDRNQDYNAAHVVWRKAMHDTRRFCDGMIRMAMGYLAGGRKDAGQAAVARLESLAGWDPDGSTSIPHNDEPHMAVLDGGPIAFDWTADLMTDAQRERIVGHLAHRAENTHRFLLDGGYGIRHFSSHSGRMVGFLGYAGIALGGHDSRAGDWLRHILELMVSMYPVWGERDGGWGEGFSYCSAYVRWILRFTLAARTALGIDLYAKPFFRNHARWWAMCLSPAAAQTPFGDGGDGVHPLPATNAAVITGHLGMMTGDPAVLDYSRRMAARVRREADNAHTAREMHRDLDTSPLIALAEPLAAGDVRGSRKLPRAEVFRDVGYAAFRSHPDDPDRDIAMIFKSSPYGPVGHSHGDQNCFVLSAYGRPLAIRTGFYTGYSSPHHHNWVRQTKAHNGVTVSGVGQWVRNHDAVGRIAGFRRGRDYAWACGDAGAAYGGRLDRFFRHVLFVDYRYFLVLDELAAPVETTFEFHLHAANPIEAELQGRAARIANAGATLDAHFLTPLDMRLYTCEGHDPPNDDPGVTDLPQQYHLRAATVPPRTRLRAAMLLIPNLDGGDDVRVEPIAGGDGAFGATVTIAGKTDELHIAVEDGDVAHIGAPAGAVACWRRDGRIRHAIKEL